MAGGSVPGHCLVAGACDGYDPRRIGAESGEIQVIFPVGGPPRSRRALHASASARLLPLPRATPPMRRRPALLLGLLLSIVACGDPPPPTPAAGFGTVQAPPPPAQSPPVAADTGLPQPLRTGAWCHSDH